MVACGHGGLDGGGEWPEASTARKAWPVVAEAGTAQGGWAGGDGGLHGVRRCGRLRRMPARCEEARPVAMEASAARRGPSGGGGGRRGMRRQTGGGRRFSDAHAPGEA